MLLPDDEKLILVNQIIESISDQKKEYPVSDDVMQLVAERIERYKANPDSGLSLEEFKKQFKERISNRK